MLGTNNCREVKLRSVRVSGEQGHGCELLTPLAIFVKYGSYERTVFSEPHLHAS